EGRLAKQASLASASTSASGRDLALRPFDDVLILPPDADHVTTPVSIYRPCWSSPRTENACFLPGVNSWRARGFPHFWRARVSPRLLPSLTWVDAADENESAPFSAL